MKNPNLDFAAFAAKIIKAVDDIRSYGSSNANSSISSSSRPTESRINAFYRLLGLPSVIPTQAPAGQTRPSTQDPLNTGNQFAGSALGISDSSMPLRMREREINFLTPVEDSEVKRFMHSNTNKLDDGIPLENRTLAERVRGTLFPMIVFGEVPIFPQDRRVADAFLERSDRTIDDSEYRPPFIEIVILMRLKGEGVTDTQLQQQLQEDFGITSQEFNALQGNIVKALAESTNTIIERVGKTVSLINESATKLSKFPVIGPNIVAEARQEFNKSIETTASVERREEKEIARDRLKDAFLFAMEFSNDGTNNMKDAPLASELISLMGGQEPSSRQDNRIQNARAKTNKDVLVSIEKAEKQGRQAFRDLEFLLGTFSGLSGVDVIVIIEALFSININQLIGFLNEGAKTRLRALKGDAVTASATSVADSQQALETRVREIYTRIMSGANTRKHREKESNRG